MVPLKISYVSKNAENILILGVKKGGKVTKTKNISYTEAYTKTSSTAADAAPAFKKRKLYNTEQNLVLFSPPAWNDTSSASESYVSIGKTTGIIKG